MTLLMKKTAIVTGASSGIGRAAAKLFAQEGAHIVAGARRQPELDALIDEITEAGGSAVALAGDVTDEGFNRALVDLAIARFGKLHIGFNNAGAINSAGPIPNTALADWNDSLAINLSSGFLAAKYQIPAMLAAGGGSLIFTSTFVGHETGFPGLAAYAAAKAGLIGLTRVLATEYGTQGIRVNALLPGGTDTPMGAAVASDPVLRKKIENLNSLKRLARPEEIARSALYLASDMSSFTTGSAMLVDAGASIERGIN